MEEDYTLTRKRFQQNDVADGYERRRFGTLKGKFLKYREEWAVRRILDRIGRGKKIMDVPCGTGRLSTVLREYSDVLLGADISAAMLQHSKATGQYAELRQCEIEKMPFLDGCVDVVVCFRFIHHLRREDRVKVFAEIWRVTNKHFIFTFNNKTSIAYILNSVFFKKGFYSETIVTIKAELDRYFNVQGTFRILPFVAGETIVVCEKRMAPSSISPLDNSGRNRKIGAE